MEEGDLVQKNLEKKEIEKGREEIKIIYSMSV